MGGGDGKSDKEYNLDERTAQFGEAVIAFVREIRSDVVTQSLISQLVRAATSIGANYAEADDAISTKDFRHRAALCRKEAKEAKHWLRMIAAAAPQCKTEARHLWCEAKELNLIFGSIVRSMSKS